MTWDANTVTAAATFAMAVLTLALGVANFLLWRATQRQIKLGRDEFNATHRARILIQSVNVVDPGRFHALLCGIRHICEIGIERNETRLSLLEDQMFVGASDNVRRCVEFVSTHHPDTIRQPVIEATECTSLV